MSSTPVVALVSPGGFLGGVFLPFFVDAARNGTFSALKLITSNASRLSSDYGTAPVSVVQVDYAKRATLEDALRGVDAIVSTMSVDAPEHEGSVENLIHAAASVGIKIYLPSEWGFDYDNFPIQGTLFEGKMAHRVSAESLGLKTIGIAVGGFIETFFSTPLFGNDGTTWSMLDDGNRPFALTAMKDIARFAIRTVAVAYATPHLIGRRVRVFSSLQPFNGYADIVERKTGQRIKRIYQSQQELDDIWNAGNVKAYFILRRFTSATDFSDHNDVELLNPGHKYWEPEKFEDFVDASSPTTKDTHTYK